MAINRTNMIDDDGSGTTGTIINNAWKQEFYGQIDALTEPFLTQSAAAIWTPSAPGIGNLGTGLYIITGKLLFIWARLTWPINSDVSPARFALPATAVNGFDGGLYQSYGPAHHRLWINNSGTNLCDVLNGATGAPRTNQELSGALFIVHGVYNGNV